MLFQQKVNVKKKDKENGDGRKKKNENKKKIYKKISYQNLRKK